MSMMNRCSSKRRKTSISFDHGASFNDHEDLIWEILFRLPPKHVLQFKCVSKRWYSIISNPVFPCDHSIRYHRHFLQPSHEFLLLPQDAKNQVLLLKLLDPPDQPLADLSVLPVTGVPVAEGPDFVFVDSCNGLILYADCHDSKRVRNRRCLSLRLFIDEDDDLYYLCNPVTKDYIKLPNLKHALLFTEEEDENKRVTMYQNLDTRIFFDPSVSLSYKVIRFVCRSVLNQPSLSQYQFYIYSSESGSWRLSTSVTGDFYFTTYSNNVFLNGVMYWMTSEIDLICFDAEKNSVWFQPLPLKPKPTFDRHPFYFGKCGGRLCLIEKYSHWCVNRRDLTLHDGFDIMEMTTEDTRWTKKYHFNLGVNHHHLSAEDIQILHIYKTRNQFKEEEEALLMKMGGRIVSFSLKSNTFFGKELTIPNSEQLHSYGDVHPTFLTFVPL